MKKKKIATALIFLSFTTHTFADCSHSRPANDNDLKNGKATSLMKGLSAACTSKVPAKFLSQQSKRIQQILHKQSDSNQQQYVRQLCDQLGPALKNPERLVYSIKQASSIECGQPISELIVENQNGQPVLRMNVNVEGNQLKLNEL